MIYNGQKSPIKKRKSIQVSPRLTREGSPPYQRLSHVPKQNSVNKEWKNLRYTFSAKSIRLLDNLQPIHKKPMLEKKSSFEDLRLAVMELQNKVYQANSEIFRKKQHTQTTKLVKSKQKPTTGFRNIPNPQRISTIRPTTYFEQTKRYDFFPKNNGSQQTCSTASLAQTNAFKPIYTNMSNMADNKQITKISQYITQQPMPEHYHSATHNPYTLSSQDKNLYYLNQVIRASNQKNSLAIQHVNASIKMIKCCILEREKDQPEANQIYESNEFRNMFEMQRLQKNWNKKTLVLDLDETLIHCYEDIAIPTDLKLKIDIEDEKIQVGVNIRPYTLSFLKRMAKKFQIVIFTASHQDYANVILDALDPENLIFSHRFYRQHCIVLSNGLHIKDLSYLPRDLRNVLLVDNAAYSYAFQLNNGIPILPYYEGKDFELIGLEKYLQKIVDVPDVRQFNKKYFKLNEYAEFETAEELINQIYTNPSRQHNLRLKTRFS